jgi:glutamate racemase
VPLVEAGRLNGPEVEEAVRNAVAPLLGERNEDGDFIFPLPPSARIDTLLLGCTHYPLLAAMLRASIGDSVAIVDSATATASSLAELLSVNALEAPGTTRGTAADAGMAGHEPPEETAVAPTHRQLTTGDVAVFRTVAERMFGEEFPDVDSVDLEAGVA